MSDSPSGRRAMTQADFEYLERLAQCAAQSGLYGGATRIRAPLLMKLIYGHDLGIPVSAALSGIDIYDGTLELSSNLIAGLVEAHRTTPTRSSSRRASAVSLSSSRTRAASAPTSPTSEATP